MRRCSLAFLGVIASLIVIAPGSIAAQQGLSEIRGRVIDTQNAILPGVTVLITNQDTGLYREVSSNSDGTYFVTGIVPGTYEVAAQLSGFKKSVRRDILLSVGRTTTVDLQLEVGGVEETVTVTTQAPLVDATSPEIGGNVTREDITDMPSVNRNYIEFLGLLPGVVPNSSTISFGADTVNVNGQNSASNNYMVDGGNNNDDYLGQGFGSQARTALESIQEFQVLTNQYDAEFGRTTGGVVNADHQAGVEPVPRQRLQLLDRFVGHRQGFLRPHAEPAQTGNHEEAVGRNARRTDRERQGAFLRQSRARHHQRRPIVGVHHPARQEFRHQPGHRRVEPAWHVPITSSPPSTPIPCAGCSRTRRRIRSSIPATPSTRCARRPTSIRRWSAS